MTQRQRQGQPPDWERITRDHPTLVHELKQLVNLAQLAESFARADPATPYHDRTPARRLRTALAETLPRTFGDYELLQELGRGAMGVVYKAWEPSLQRHVAVKMLLRGEHATVTDVTRFRGEAQSAAVLSHRNIVPVYKVGQCEGRAYFSMKYVQGQTLAQKIARKPLPGREAAQLLSAISRGVHHAHQNGILHRDLKPSNVLIDAEGQPLVTDFGLAKRVEGGPNLTGTGAIVGTPSYMAPEQAAGGRGGPSPASDVYSLGAILYEMLTGRPAVPGPRPSPAACYSWCASEEAVRPRLLNPQIDPDLEVICLKCLEKRPDHRYASAAALADDLDAVLQSEPVSARISNLAYFVSRLLRETHHAPVLENWGLLWMWHSHRRFFLLCGCDQRAVLDGGEATRRVHDALGRRSGSLGGFLLELAAARRSGNVCGTADGSCVGGRRGGLGRRLYCRSAAGAGGVKAVADPGGVCGHGVSVQGGHVVRLVLRGRGGDVFDGGADGAFSGGGTIAFRSGVRGELFCARAEVLPAAPFR